jgi:hypothetical protein
MYIYTYIYICIPIYTYSYLYIHRYPSTELQDAAFKLISSMTHVKRNSTTKNLAFFDEIDGSKGFGSKGSGSIDSLEVRFTVCVYLYM